MKDNLTYRGIVSKPKNKVGIYFESTEEDVTLKHGERHEFFPSITLEIDKDDALHIIKRLKEEFKIT